MEAADDQLRADVVQDRAGIFGKLGNAVGEIVESAQLQGKLHRTVGQAGKIFVDTVNELVAKPSAGGGIEVKPHAVASCGTSSHLRSRRRIPAGRKAGVQDYSSGPRALRVCLCPRRWRVDG